MGEIVAIVNQKGGVGKTTLAVHLGAWLAQQGFLVIAVDGDPQGNLTSWLMDGDFGVGLFRSLVVGDLLERTLVQGKFGMWLVPGGPRTAEAMVFLAATGRPFETVRNAVRPLARAVDVVLVDMPPSRAAGFEELLAAADWALVPTKLERLSLEGVMLLAGVAARMREERGYGPRLMGVVPNMARITTREHREQMEELVKVFGTLVWPPVRLSTAVAEASGYGETVFEHAPRAEVCRDLKEVARRFRGVIAREGAA